MSQLPIEQKHSCTCGGHAQEIPELDARTIPHAVRHGAILGAMSQLPSGASMVLVAPHDPLPLLEQMKQAFGQIGIEYVERAEGMVKVKLTRP